VREHSSHFSGEDNLCNGTGVPKLNKSLFDLSFKRSFLMLWRPFAFVGNDASNSRGNSGIAGGAPCFRALVQYLFSFLLHAITIAQPLHESKKLKAESRLQIDAPIRS
jgi:hypothetical protein